MKKKFKIVALITARSGSKRIKNKNIKNLFGKPLVYYTIKQALKIRLINRVIFSTDSEQYSKIASNFGAECLSLRPKKYSQDSSSDFQAFNFNEYWLNKNEDYFTDIYVHLRPTFPLRRLLDIQKMIKLMILNYSKADSVRSVIPSNQFPEKTYIIKKSGFLHSSVGFKRISKKDDFLCNQSHSLLNKYYKGNGCLDVFKASCLKKNSVTGKNIIPYLMKIKDSIDIDRLSDFKKIKKKDIIKLK